ncbi:MAG: hypothetical protein IKA71_07380 [Lentisphaeria bacterium]|nr:hypothetical protein [Lentisphaeria bacterium]
MFKKIMMIGLAAVTAVLFTGCSSLQTAGKNDFNGLDLTTKGTPVAHISATTHGLYLLWIPLITGSSTQLGMPCFLEDTVSCEAITKMVTAEAQKQGGKEVIDLVTQSSSSGLLFQYKVTTASGTAIK